jgi:uncharacterized protein (TIGR02118 family)
MIRVIAPALRHPFHRTLLEFHRYWAEVHGPLCARMTGVRRYAQLHTLPEAYGDAPAPSYDGASMFWFDDLDALTSVVTQPESTALWTTIVADDAQLFDRGSSWPTDHRKATVIGTEHVVVDGQATPEMVKAIFVSARRPGLTVEEYVSQWATAHAALVAELPGLRRYVQTHGLPEAYALTASLAPTHDGCSELWFDDYRAWKSALNSPQWSAVVDAGETLFARPSAYVIGREQFLKD